MSDKITVKKNLIIFHCPNEWQEIYHQILQDFGSKMSISFVLKRELGFTIRNHKGLVSANSKVDPTLKYYEDQIHLDFYNETAQSWFQLKYLNR
jgi:hypothetical protein